MNGMFRTPDCADQPSRRAMSIKAAQRAALDARSFNVEGIAMVMSEVRGERLDVATLRRYLSDTYKGCTPVDLVHPWFVATDGDLSPVRQQLHPCGFGLRPLWEDLGPASDSPLMAAELSQESGDLVALLIKQWTDGGRTTEERKRALPMMLHLRAQLDRLIGVDESATGGK